MSFASSLVSTQSLVQCPFIIVKVGKYTFGHCEKEYKNRLQTSFNIEYPNYMQSLNIVKVNGTVNTYNLTMVYAITEQDDPNRLEKIFSSVSKTRKITLSYGDWNTPNYIYKEEEATITKLTTKVNMQKSSITYTITCISNAIKLTSNTFSFPAKRAKPSSEIKRLLDNKIYGLTDIFTGMKNLTLVAMNNLIATDDKSVQLEAKTSISVMEYISYLVSCMVYIGEKSNGIKQNCYFWSVFDDTSGTYGGTYFKVVRVAANTPSLVSYNTYEVDIGFPTANCVTDFSINNDDSWSLLYNYSNDVVTRTNSYYIDNSGHLVQQESPATLNSKQTYIYSESARNWWSLVTQFPITATLTLKGLLRPAMLMSYVRVNTYFYGRKHTSSGLYVITKQEDSINSSGYKTTLSLLRVGGDESYV